ncbi:MAG: ribonuclease P protein component 4 [Nanoarchaeota archaeon]
MARRFKSEKKRIKRIATQRMENLVKLSGRMYPKDHELSRKYIRLARKIGMKANIRFSRHNRRKFCRYCDTPFIPGVNCRVRLTGKTITYYCKNCKKFRRIRYKC